MRFHSSVTDSESAADAIDRLIDEARAALGQQIDAAFVFFTAHHQDQADEIVERLWLELDPRSVVGCSGEGVIGGDREIERAPGMSLLTAELPGVGLHPFHIGFAEWRELLADRAALAERLGCGGETRGIIGFGDPFTTPVVQLLPALDELCPSAPLIGGMASSAHTRGGNSLLKNDQVYNEGMVGVSLGGAIDVQAVVSQGCCPIGKPWVITRSRENVIEQLGGRPAMEVLKEFIDAMGESEKQQLSTGLLIGRAISEYKDRFGRGDFLIRNISGVSEKTGMIAVNDLVRTGQTVQFHVRDAVTAHEDLSQLLSMQPADAQAAGALLFSCNGRGTNLFDHSGHDITTAHDTMPTTPVAGFFAAGEIGPVGGKNFIHGHTASFAMMRGRATVA